MEDCKMKCPCCGSRRTMILYRNMKDKMHFVKGNFFLMKCEDCELEFIKPLLNEKQLAKYYPAQDYYSFKKNKLLSIYHKISAYYYSGKSRVANILLYPLKTILSRYYTKNCKGKRILEIGCGNGFQLEVYKKYGLKTRGLEPYGPTLTEREKNLGIKRGSIGKADYPNNYFDYIIMREVLEHIPNQKEVIEKCKKWLKLEGLLIITVPNTKSLWKKAFKKNWYGYDVPRHVYDYNPKSISFFLEKEGFKINKIQVFDLPYMLYGSIKFSNGELKKKKELNILLKLIFTPISLIASLLNQGSLMEIEAQKNDKSKSKHNYRA